MSNVQLGMMTAAIPEPAAATVATAGISASAIQIPQTSATIAASPEAMLQIAHQVGEGLKAKAAGLDYRIDMIGGMPRVRIIDAQSGLIVRQLPNDEILSVFHAMDRKGVLLSKKVG